MADLDESVAAPSALSYVARAMADGGSGNSPVVLELEDAFAAFKQARFALCVASGTAALIAACRAVGVGPGDVVGVSALGPVMSGQAVLATGARPLFLDCASPSSFGISPAAAATAAKRGARAVIVVPMWGYWDEQPAALGLLRQSGVPVIADIAQAPFLALDPGLLDVADIACLSLHSRKPLRAGEGGVCLTNQRRYADSIVAARNFGQQAELKAGHLVPGGAFGAQPGSNLKMNALGAAWCLAQMQDLPGIRARLGKLRNRALEAFGSAGVPWQEAAESAEVTEHGGYGIAAMCADEATAGELARRLAGQGIEVDTQRYGYQPMYRAACFGPAEQTCPAAEQLARVTVACRLEAFAGARPTSLPGS
jgi:dTDP-4-amino-4,6-dideoxygalactose transaminase